MVLAKREIYERLQKDLIITPLLESNAQIGEASIDVRLGREFIVTKHTRISSLNPIRRTVLEKTIPLYQEKIKLDFGQPYILHPQELVLASTLEFIALPKDLMAYVVGRSSWGRLGLIIATATMVDPLYRGVITLELINVGRLPIHLYPCARVAQLVLHAVPNGEERTDFDHKYQDSFEPSFSLIYRDKELSKLVDQPFQYAIGLTGLRGAGKSEVVNYLTLEKGFLSFNISDIVKAEAMEQGLEIDRRALQDYGDEVRSRENRLQTEISGTFDTSYFARKMLEIIRESDSPGKFILISGIRNPGEVLHLKKNIRNFFLLAVTAHPETRYAWRELEGEHEERTAFDQADKRDFGDMSQSWGQNIGACIELARDSNGFVIENGKDVEKEGLRNKVQEVINQISKKLSWKGSAVDDEEFSRLKAKLSLSESALLEEIGASVARTEGFDLSALRPDALREKGQRWLELQNANLTRKICKDWNFSEKIKDPRYQDSVILSAAIADLIAGMFKLVPPVTVAVLLVKRGLERLCA